VRLTNEAFPRLTIGRVPSRAPAIGPLTTSMAETVREALESAAPVRRCTERMGVQTRFQSCALAQIGRCAAPCEGRVGRQEYASLAAPVAAAIDGAPGAALDALALQMERLASARRYEEAAGTRHRLGALVSALLRQRAADALVAAGDLQIEASGVRLDVASGVLASVDGAPLAAPPDDHPDEPRLIAAWLGRHRPIVRAAAGVYAFPVAGGRALSSWSRRLRDATR
jgi:excinuclease UvrABC nuclease subunit